MNPTKRKKLYRSKIAAEQAKVKESVAEVVSHTQTAPVVELPAVVVLVADADSTLPQVESVVEAPKTATKKTKKTVETDD